MKDIFDLFAEGVIKEDNEFDRSLAKSVIIDEIVERFDYVSEGVIKKLSVKALTNETRQKRMIDGKSVNSGTHVKYDIQDVKREIDCVEYYIKHDKGLTDGQKKSLKEYLPKLKARFQKLGGSKEWQYARDKEGMKNIGLAVAAKATGII